jgi:calcium-dependent protein kinase
MLSYQLLTGMFPFWEDVRAETLQDVWSAILNDPIDWEAPELRTLTPLARNFLQKMMQRNPGGWGALQRRAAGPARPPAASC